MCELVLVGTSTSACVFPHLNSSVTTGVLMVSASKQCQEVGDVLNELWINL